MLYSTKVQGSLCCGLAYILCAFYEALVKRYGENGGNRVPKGCYAEVLQNVMAEIRRDSPGNVLQWAPFVHFGV